jgi:pilus assembly protein Flp/PilA
MALLYKIRDLFEDETGATAIEYALILGLIAMVVVFALTGLRDSLGNMYNFVAAQVDASMPANPG